ncbi:hypothetical protein B6E66_13820 [Streptomyces maremycinicus]|nr:hypothetical protein B6E66_13820 [Streptomyces sp. B9173]
MITSSWESSRRFAAAASVLTVTTVLAVAVALALGTGLPDAWWPHTGQAFAASAGPAHAAGARPAHHGRCAAIVGPAKAYCERGATAGSRQDLAGAAWRLGSAGAGVGAVVVWRLRYAAGRRRR